VTDGAVPVTTWLPPVAGAPDDLLALLPAGYDELRALYAGLWETDFDPVTLELCRLRLATLVRSTADLATRDPRAVAAGLDEELVGDLPSWPSSSRFTDAQRAALAFTEQYVIDPQGFTDADAERMHRHFTPPQLATLTTAVATFDALARVRALLRADPATSTLPTRDATVGVTLA
jgi:alkylhydroperoxidase family enzyme